MFKDEFYASLRNDFSAHTTKSFLYQYFKQEKEDNIRLKLKQNYAERKNTMEDRIEYAKVLAEGLLENPKMQKLYPEFDIVFSKLGLDFETQELRQKKNKTDKIKTALKNFITQILKNNEECIPELEDLHIATQEIFKKAGHTLIRKDTYVHLMESYLDYEMGSSAQGSYLYELTTLLGSNTKLRLTKESREILLELGKSLAGEDTYNAAGKDSEKYMKISELLKREPALLEKNDLLNSREIKIITEELLDYILKMDVKTFLYDIGYSERTGDGTIGESRKKDRTMDMLDKYCKDHHIYFTPQIGAGNNEKAKLDDPEYIKECRKLFAQLNRDKITKVFIPLAIDPASGAGVYIIGREYYKEVPDRQAEILESCCYSCLFFDEIIIDESGTVNLVMGEISVFDTLESAIKVYKYQLESRGVMVGYQSNNEKIPRGGSGYFSIYFDTEKWEHELSLDMENNRNFLNKEANDEARRRALMECAGGWRMRRR